MSLLNVSVVIPTYNRAHILINTLLSLKYQTYPQKKFEIIVVDDGSTDNTYQMLQKLSINNLSVIRYEHNKGDGYARNRGWEAANGELIVFCDSDVILPSTCIASHFKAHGKNKLLAVSGLGHWHHVLTYDYKDEWAAHQKVRLAKEYDRPFIRRRIKESADHNLITEKDISLQRIDSFLISRDNPLRNWSMMYDEIIDEFGYELNRFQCPWLSFCTGNVSIRKDILRELGGFDERIPRLKDLELGYRFFLMGGRFCFSKDAEAFMQLTPRDPGRKNVAFEGWKLFSGKHPALEVYLLGLDISGQLNYKEFSNLLKQHYTLKSSKPHLKALTHQFENIACMFSQGLPPPFSHSLRQQMGWESVQEQRKELKNTEKYNIWLKYFDKLMFGS